METTLFNADGYNYLLSRLELPAEKQRIQFYQGKLYPVNIGKKVETDTHLYYMVQHLTPKFNNKIYIKSNNTEGLSYDKTTGEFKMWFGKQFYLLPMLLQDDFMKTFKIDWWKSLSSNAKNLANNTIVKKIISNKITNPRDFIKAFAKQSFKNSDNVSYELLYKIFANDDRLSLRQHVDNAKYATDVNQYFQKLLAYVDAGYSLNWPNYNSQAEKEWGVITDLIHQAKQLNRKVNVMWSSTKMNQVHTQWTKDLMQYELEDMSLINYEYPEGLPVIPELELVKDNHDLFTEGKVMKHCVYTNYSYQVENYGYVVFRYTDGETRGTLGIRLSEYEATKATIHQFYGKYNSSIKEEHHERIKAWLNQSEVQEWFHSVIKLEKKLSNVENLMPL
jgi:hypothetical protein